MNFQIAIDGTGNDQLVSSLDVESNVLGSSAQCNIRVRHAEMQPRALQIDVRGSDIWIQNLSPYSIYIGQEEVSTNSWSIWGVDQRIQLTQSLGVTLGKTEASTIQDGGNSEAAGVQDQQKSKGNSNLSKAIQVLAIVGLFSAAVLILFAGSSQSSPIEKSKFDITDVVENLNSDIDNPEIRIIRNALQTAVIADSRAGSRDKANVLKKYQQLYRHRLLQLDEVASVDLRTSTKEQLQQIKEFVQLRLAELTR